MKAPEKSRNSCITGTCAHSLTHRRNLCTHLLTLGLYQLVILFLFSQTLMSSKESNPSLQTLQPNENCAGMLAKTAIPLVFISRWSTSKVACIRWPRARDLDSEGWTPLTPSPVLLILPRNCCKWGILHPTHFWSIHPVLQKMLPGKLRTMTKP